MSALFAKKTISNNVANKIDVGFYPYGPTLSIGGGLSTDKKVFLIDRISITVQAPFQPEHIEFDWFTLQPHAALKAQFEILNSPSKFVLSPGKPYEYYIMFVDNARYAQMKTLLVNIAASWQGMREHDESHKPEAELFDSFQNMPMIQEQINMLRQLCYWQAGTYYIEINIATKEDIFTARKKFELPGADIQQIKTNSTDIIYSACNQPANYNILTVELLNAK